MYAVVKIGGHQYRVAPGEVVVVDRLSGKTGDTVELPALLVVDDKKQVKVGKEASETKVLVKITGIGQGEKIDIRRFRNKSRHQRHIGFRAQLTNVVVESIGSVKVASKSSKKPSA